MNDYVIAFTSNGQVCKVIWTGSSASDALSTFWASFDDIDAKKVSNVRIFNLVEVSAYNPNRQAVDM